MLTGASVLVTGGAGFIGSHLVEQLVNLDAQVTVIDNLVTGDIKNLNNVISDINFLAEDMGGLLRRQAIDLGQYDYVFHLAANPYIPPSVEKPSYDFALNLENTFLLLEALRLSTAPPFLINTSSAAVYGNPKTLPIKEGDPTIPISPYGVSKLAAERYASVYSQLYGIKVASLRLFSVFGPRQRKQVVYDLLKRLRDDPANLKVYGDGSQTRDFIYVTDVAKAMCLAAVSTRGEGEVYNVASGSIYSISELVKNWIRVCGFTPTIQYSGQVRAGDADKWEVDISALKNIGFLPTVSLNDGLKEILDWYDKSFR